MLAATPVNPRHFVPNCSMQALDAELLFRNHARFVAKFLRRRGAPEDAVDDLVQEVFIVAHRRGGFVQDGRAEPTTWLAQIGLRVLSSNRRGRRRAREAPDHDAVHSAATQDDDPQRTLETHRAMVGVQLALDTLEPDLRATLVLYALQGETCGVIAELFAVSVGTIYSRLHRARRRLKVAHARIRSRSARPVASASCRRAFP